jgi:4-aminobutyrate aminotransferase-like enzyme
MRERGVLIGRVGPAGNVLTIRPPMVFDMGNAEHLLNVLDAALWETEK